MTIEIVEIKTIQDETGADVAQHAEIIILDSGTDYAWRVGGIPLDEPDVQSYLEARESRYLQAAIAAQAESPELYKNVTTWRILKAFALVVLDEINILRQSAGLSQRSASQIENAIKTKLRQ